MASSVSGRGRYRLWHCCFCWPQYYCDGSIAREGPSRLERFLRSARPNSDTIQNQTGILNTTEIFRVSYIYDFCCRGSNLYISWFILKPVVVVSVIFSKLMKNILRISYTKKSSRGNAPFPHAVLARERESLILKPIHGGNRNWYIARW